MIAAQAMNHGTLAMSRTSDIPYHVLETTYQQYLRQQTLQAANDRISNAIAEMPIFPHYSFDLETLYGAVDGQNFGVERLTAKARHSRKYFGRGKRRGRLHAAVQPHPAAGLAYRRTRARGPPRFDVWYRNTSEIAPEAITGDMHSVNKANFAILHFFSTASPPNHLLSLRCIKTQPS